jgi:hypothetical protein
MDLAQKKISALVFCPGSVVLKEVNRNHLLEQND